VEETSSGQGEFRGHCGRPPASSRNLNEKSRQLILIPKKVKTAAYDMSTGLQHFDTSLYDPALAHNFQIPPYSDAM
jgi:hypothetical protein